MPLYIKSLSLGCLGLFFGCQVALPVGGSDDPPTPQHSATLSFTSPPPTPKALPTPWVPPPLLDKCGEDPDNMAPYDVAVTKNGSHLYFSTRDARLFEVINHQAKQIQNKEGKCLFGLAGEIETDSKGNLFLVSGWRFEQIYFGSRVYFIKPDLSEIKVVSEYNAKYIPRPQGTPPVGTYHEGIGDLYVSPENKGFFTWETNAVELTENSYIVIPFSEQAQPAKAYLLASGLNNITQIGYDDSSRNLYFFSKGDNLKNSSHQNEPFNPKVIEAPQNLEHPFDFRLDPKTGDLIVSDFYQIVRLNPISGNISTIAGQSHVEGYLDGKGKAALFKQAYALDLDATGNIYVADSGNQAIRKITPEGQVSTLYKAPSPVSNLQDE